MIRNRALALLAGMVVLAGCAAPGPRHGFAPGRAEVRERGDDLRRTGIASYYARRFHGRVTASGELHDEDALVAAHRTLPFGTRVRVTHLATERSVVVRINDRGPYAPGRILDLSRRAARELGFLDAGLARVRIDVL